MSKRVECSKHKVSPATDEWQVTFDELTDKDDDRCEPFCGQVCPVCFMNLRERHRKTKRELKTQSRENIRLRTVLELTGKDRHSLNLS